MRVPYYVVTNGNEFRVYKFAGPFQQDIPIFNFDKREIPNHWEDIYKTLSKEAVLKYKKKMKELVARVAAYWAIGR